MRKINAQTPPGVGTRAARVTISDVAAALGLAKGTVSRALNGYPDIAEATRLRVSAAAERMGYVPLSHAQAIRTGRVRALGLVLQVCAHDAQRLFLAEFVAGITTAASKEDWTLTIATAPTEDEVLVTMRRLIHERKADGFIIPRTRTRDPRIKVVRDAGLPFVLWGRTGDPTDCAWFDILGEDAMREAVRRFHALGHRRIGFLGGGTGYHYSLLRWQGYREALEEVGLRYDRDIVGRDANTLAGGTDAARALLATDRPPTAIVCATDNGALGVYAAAGELGLRIGEDVSVMSYDGVPEGAYATPPLTTYEVDSRAAGHRLAELLIYRIRGDAPEDLRETAGPTLRPGGSDRPPARTSEALRAAIDTDYRATRTHQGGTR